MDGIPPRDLTTRGGMPCFLRIVGIAAAFGKPQWKFLIDDD